MADDLSDYVAARNYANSPAGQARAKFDMQQTAQAEDARVATAREIKGEYPAGPGINHYNYPQAASDGNLPPSGAPPEQFDPRYAVAPDPRTLQEKTDEFHLPNVLNELGATPQVMSNLPPEELGNAQLTRMAYNATAKALQEGVDFVGSLMSTMPDQPKTNIQIPTIGEDMGGVVGKIPISEGEQFGTFMGSLAIGSLGVSKVTKPVGAVQNLMSDAIVGMVFQDPGKGEKTISPWLLDHLGIKNEDVQQALDAGNYDDLTARIVNGGEWGALGLAIPKTGKLAWAIGSGIAKGLVRLAKGELRGTAPGSMAAQGGHIGVPNPRSIPVLSANAQQFPNQRAFGEHVVKQGRPIEETPENVKVLGQHMAREVIAAIEQDVNAATWYRDKVDGAKRIAKVLYPELSNGDPYYMTAFEASMALMSNGTSIADNVLFADRAFQEFTATGKFPENVEYAGKEAGSIGKGFALFNKLAEQYGPDDLIKFLESKFTVGELEKAIGITVSGELKDTLVHGSAVFGPKIGNGFFQNLHGNFNVLTMDRWWMRMWGRITGSLIPKPSESTTLKRLDRFRAAVTPEAMKAAGIRTTSIEDAKPETLKRAARVIFQDYRRGGFKERTELNRAAKNLVEHETQLVDAPGGGSDRNYMREVADHALAITNEQYPDIRLADMQALLWYPEKDLYKLFGVSDAKGAPTDYEIEFEKLARERGAIK